MAEIYWEGEKLSHFELITKLIEHQDTKNFVLSSLKQISEKFDQKKVTDIVRNIDKPLIILENPDFLPNERKQLVLKLLNSRFTKLREIYSQYK